MVQQRVLLFEYQQSLKQESDQKSWSPDISVSVRLFAEAITTGWYRVQFASRGNNFVILLAIAMHARPLLGDDLNLLLRLQMVTPDDAGRLYARVSDVALADELGISRMTVARATARLADDKSITMLEIPRERTAFRDSHGRFNGTKVYLIAGDIQNRFLEKSVEIVDRASNSIPAGCHPMAKYSQAVPDLSINAIKDEDEEEVVADLVERVFLYFARRKGDPRYHPTYKEQAALKDMIRDGFTFEQIVSGIEAAFARPSRPNYFTHCARITRDLAPSLLASRTPETRQPETREPEAVRKLDSESPVPIEIIEAQLGSAIAVYRSSGREITSDLLARFRLMVTRCEQAARAAGSTGGDWLANAISIALGVAQPANLLNYSEAVLNDWTINGRKNKPVKQPVSYASTHPQTIQPRREPAAHAGIRAYLEKHGDIPSGDRD